MYKNLPRLRLTLRTAWITGLLTSTFSTLVIVFASHRIGRGVALSFTEVGMVLLRDKAVDRDPEWLGVISGIVVHQSADIFWAVVFWGIRQVHLGPETQSVAGASYSVGTRNGCSRVLHISSAEPAAAADANTLLDGRRSAHQFSCCIPCFLSRAKARDWDFGACPVCSSRCDDARWTSPSGRLCGDSLRAEDGAVFASSIGA